MLDVASGGRVISGFVRGISAEYFSTAVNPTHSRERFYEAAELILRAWTEEGPFAFDGASTATRTSTRGRGRSRSPIRPCGVPPRAAARRWSGRPSDASRI